MHIAEGMLPGPYALAYWIGAGTFVTVGAKSLASKSREIPMMKQLVGVMTAGIFLVSLLPIPVPGSYSSGTSYYGVNEFGCPIISSPLLFPRRIDDTWGKHPDYGSFWRLCRLDAFLGTATS